MSVLVVAKKDFRDAIRSRMLFALVALFVLFITGIAYFYIEIAPNALSTTSKSWTSAIIISLTTPTQYLLPIIGTMVGYKAIVGERESGSLKILLSLPHTRSDVIFGKLLGRSAVITVAVIVGFTSGGLVLYVLSDSFLIGNYLIFSGMTILLGIVFISISIAFSSVFRSSTVAIVGAAGLALLFILLWDVIVLLVEYVATRLSLIDPVGTPNWVSFLANLNPTIAFSNALSAILGEKIALSIAASYLRLPNQPFYLKPWFGFIILIFWLIVPIGLAYFRFRNTDL